MKLGRRRFIQLAANAATLAIAPRIASAETYPTRPVHLIVGYPPAGFVDITARLVGAWLSERLGQPFIVENRPGASSNIGTQAALRALPDGHTLLVASNANTYNATLYEKLDFNFIRDFAPIATVMRAPFVMAVNPSIPARTVPEFIAYAKSVPGKINMATAGPGSATAIFSALFQMMAGVHLVTVPYLGVGPALPDVVSGHVQVLFVPVAAALGYIRSGKLRPLGVTTVSRVDVLPDLPAIGEFVPGYRGSGWAGIGGPANTPPEIIATLNQHVNAALADPTFRARLLDLGTQPFANSPPEFEKFISDETAKWGKVIRQIGMRTG